MPFVITSLLPFPNILWWCEVLQADKVIWDVHERFEKMSFRNRYFIAGAQGLMKMSIPIRGGRTHKPIMSETFIANQDKWQIQHWRTIVSAYNNAPYFHFYKPSLETLFTTPFEKLTEFNHAGISWLKQHINFSFTEEKAAAYMRHYPGAVADLRSFPATGFTDSFPGYYQVFQERTGFLPNLSLLDLLFAEGPHTLQWLKTNVATITLQARFAK